MKLSHLRTFVSIADTGGFARAAARLHLTQSAASRQIHALEAEVGVALFDRVGRRVQLTSEGEDLLRHCRRVLAEIDSIGDRARALKSGQAAGVLRVGTTPQAIESLLAEFLVRHRRRHRGVEVVLVEDGGARLLSRLERGDVHLAIVATDEERFPGRPLFPTYVLAVLPERHRFSRRAVLEVGDLADEPLLRLNQSFASHAWFEAACRLAHIRPRVLLESAAPQTLISLARTGYGIAIVPSPVRIARERVRVLPVVHRGVPLGRWMVVAWDPRRFQARHAEQFVEEIVDYCRRDYPGRDYTRRAPPLPKPKHADS